MDRIDRKKVVKRHNPVLTAIDYESPLTVGNVFFPIPLMLQECSRRVAYAAEKKKAMKRFTNGCTTIPTGIIWWRRGYYTTAERWSPELSAGSARNLICMRGLPKRISAWRRSLQRPDGLRGRGQRCFFSAQPRITGWKNKNQDTPALSRYENRRRRLGAGGAAYHGACAAAGKQRPAGSPDGQGFPLFFSAQCGMMSTKKTLLPKTKNTKAGYPYEPGGISAAV